MDKSAEGQNPDEGNFGTRIYSEEVFFRGALVTSDMMRSQFPAWVCNMNSPSQQRWALVRRTYEEDPKTGKKKLTAEQVLNCGF